MNIEQKKKIFDGILAHFGPHYVCGTILLLRE